MQETQICNNCKKEILVSKSGTHMGYCRRNIIKCSTCGEMYDKNFLEEHQDEFHLNKQCEYCSNKFKSKDLNAHMSSCVMKPKYCEYCQLNVPSKEYNVHLKTCESRTSICQLCQKSIVNKESALHKAICKGKQTPKSTENAFLSKPQKENYRFEDSLSNFDNLNDFYDRGFKKEAKKVEPKQKQKNKKQSKKQQKPIISPSKNDKQLFSKKQESPQKKQTKDPKLLSRQHFYNNYFQNSPEYFDYADEQLNQSQFNAFLPQYSIIQPNYYDGGGFGVPQSERNTDLDGISMQEQLIQQTLFESSKKQKSKFTASNLSKDLPSDLLSNEIMNSSFYHDILDIQKQKAIQEDLEAKNKKTQKVSKKK